MAGKPKTAEQQRLQSAVEDSRAASKELAKDAAQLSRQAAVLKAEVAEARLEAQETRARATRLRACAEILRTIPEAAHDLHIAERTLRHVLQEPCLQERLIERTRKVGIYHKFIPLLPPDLLTDLAARLAAKNSPDSH